tara:strand:+ start:510555 stop:510734 length:180 start_codon:yes stop_codon:yes gene_type:complete
MMAILISGTLPLQVGGRVFDGHNLFLRDIFQLCIVIRRDIQKMFFYLGLRVFKLMMLGQ